MTAINNVIIDYGGSNQFTIYTTRVETDYAKRFVTIIPPQTDKSAGPKDTIIVDLLRIEKRITVRGHIDSSDFQTAIAALEAGTTMSVAYTDFSTPLVGNIEKLSITKDDTEDDHRSILLTFVVGTGFGE